MIPMRMGDKDMGYAAPAIGSLKDSPQVSRVIRAGVDHRHLRTAQKICIGAAMRHGRGIGCDDAPHTLSKRQSHPCGWVEIG